MSEDRLDGKSGCHESDELESRVALGTFENFRIPNPPKQLAPSIVFTGLALPSVIVDTLEIQQRKDFFLTK